MRSIVLCCLLLAVSGCGVVAAINNGSALEQIQAGDSYVSVTDRLFGYRLKESTLEYGHRFKVISAQAGSIGNYVPFVFMDDVLIGYGQNYFSRFEAARRSSSTDFYQMIGVGPPASYSGRQAYQQPSFPATTESVADDRLENEPTTIYLDSEKDSQEEKPPSASTTTPKTIITPSPGTAENGDIYGVDNDGDGRVETIHVRGYFRKDGTYVRGHYRAKPK